MDRFGIVVTLVVVVSSAINSQAQAGTVFAEYDPGTGNIIVIAEDVVEWFVQSYSDSLTGLAPVGIPPAGLPTLATDNDARIGLAAFTPFSTPRTNLGPVADWGLPYDDLTFTWYETLGGERRTVSIPHGYGPIAYLDGLLVDLNNDPLSILLEPSSIFDDGLDAPPTYSWDLDNDGTFEVDTGTTDSLAIADVTATFGGVGVYPVAVKVFDGEYYYDVATAIVELMVNTPPTAGINGPFERHLFHDPPSILLDAGSSFDDPLLVPLTYFWDLDDDGTFEVDTGTNDRLHVNLLDAPFGHDGDYTVAVQVFDGEFYDTASTTVTLVTPEPSTVVLVGVGLALVVSLRRY